MDLSKYLTSEEAAEHLGISRRVLYNLAYRDPDFPAPTKVGRTSLWTPEDLDAWRQRHPARRKKGSS